MSVPTLIERYLSRISVPPVSGTIRVECGIFAFYIHIIYYCRISVDGSIQLAQRNTWERVYVYDCTQNYPKIVLVIIVEGGLFS